MKQSKISALGIDLGTTNSAAAMIAWDPASGAPPEVRGNTGQGPIKMMAMIIRFSDRDGERLWFN